MKRKTVLYTIVVTTLSLSVMLGARAILWTTQSRLTARNDAQQTALVRMNSLASMAGELEDILEHIQDADAHEKAPRLVRILEDSAELVSTWTEAAGSEALREKGKQLGWALFDIHGIGNRLASLAESRENDRAAKLAEDIGRASLANYQSILNDTREAQYEYTTQVWASFNALNEKTNSMVLVVIWLIVTGMGLAVILASHAVKSIANDHDRLLDEILAEQEALSPFEQYRRELENGNLDSDGLIDADLLPDEDLLLDEPQESAAPLAKEWGPRLVPQEERPMRSVLNNGRKAFDAKGLVLIK